MTNRPFAHVSLDSKIIWFSLFYKRYYPLMMAKLSSFMQSSMKIKYIFPYSVQNENVVTTCEMSWYFTRFKYMQILWKL